jgi:uncharacterized membrane protein YphA (DoxX/SURF4 family)
MPPSSQRSDVPSQSGATLTGPVADELPATPTRGGDSGSWRDVFWRVQPWVTTVLRVGLAVVFTIAAWPKLSDPDANVRAVRAYQILPESLVHTVAYAQPYLELAVALLLFLGLGTRIVGAITTIMLMLFIAAVASVAARGIKIDCGCFGGGGAVVQTHYTAEILRDTGFLLMALWVTILPTSKFALDNWLKEV